MKVWAAFSGQDIIGIFTEAHRAAEFSADYNQTDIEDADYVGFDVWQFPPQRRTYWIASASQVEGDPAHVTMSKQELWSHQPIDLPTPVAASSYRVRHTPGCLGCLDAPHRTYVQVYDWEEAGLADRASAWLNELLNL